MTTVDHTAGAIELLRKREAELETELHQVRRALAALSAPAIRRQIPLEQRTHLAANLTEARKAAGLSQAKAARAIGVVQAAVGKWELGTAKPTPDNLARAAMVYNTTTKVLTAGD